MAAPGTGAGRRRGEAVRSAVVPDLRFSADDGFDFAVRCLLTGVGYSMAEPGEVLATAASIEPGDLEGWFRAWTELGARCDAIGDRAARAGHDHSASDAYLRAANYRYAGFWYVLGSADPGRHLSAWRAHRTSLRNALSHWDQAAEQLTVSWYGSVMRGWLVRPAAGTGDGDHPLMVIHNGLGSPMSDTVMTGLADAARRGWATLVFDGPGQGRMRFVEGVGPVDDWGRVGRAVLDAALAAGGVDERRIVAVGISDGGYLAARHAADDDRIAALVCDPGVLRPIDGVLGGLPDALQQAWAAGGAAAVDAAVAEADDAGTAFAAAKAVEQWPEHTVGTVLARLAAWDLAPALPNIRVPTLVCDPEGATSFPGQSAELCDALGRHATRLAFTAAEGAELDCEILAPRLRNQRVFDHLDELFSR
jgi:poly(3-hydroxybutyrate) depolymerase